MRPESRICDLYSLYERELGIAMVVTFMVVVPQ